jgi:hypothetical protein
MPCALRLRSWDQMRSTLLLARQLTDLIKPAGSVPARLAALPKLRAAHFTIRLPAIMMVARGPALARSMFKANVHQAGE